MSVFADRSAEIARFKKEFETMRKNMDTGAIISAVEGISEVQAGILVVQGSTTNVERSIANLERNGKVLHLLDWIN